HRAGEKLFVDYAGQTAPIIDRSTGEIRQAQIFVAVLGASSYTFAEATWSQKLPDWLGSHVRCFAFFNPSYRDLAEHYGVAVLPARSRKPKDKAKVEVGVQVVERWILAVLRNRQFFSLGELNTAISLLLERLNHKPFKKLPGSRRSAFESIDQPALSLLLGAVPVGEAPTRSTTHRPDRRVLPRQPARGQPPSLAAQRPAHHPNRAHAQEPPRARRMDTATADPLGRADRAQHRWRHHLHPRTPNPSATRLPRLPGHPAPEQTARRITKASNRSCAKGWKSYRCPSKTSRCCPTSTSTCAALATTTDLKKELRNATESNARQAANPAPARHDQGAWRTTRNA
ncbi:ISPsy14, transposase, partial [Pseudomonas syringae pv. actinidiae ICMP 18801]